jgi:hypothetical protein
MNTELNEEFQWIYDNDETVTPVDPTESLATLAGLDSVTAALPLLSQSGDDDLTRVQSSLAPMYAVSEPYLGTASFPPVPEPPVNTAPRPVTIVWGFVIMAIGVLAISFAAGVAVDLGLVLVWLPALCGFALIAAAILSAVKRA